MVPIYSTTSRVLLALAVMPYLGLPLLWFGVRPFSFMFGLFFMLPMTTFGAAVYCLWIWFPEAERPPRRRVLVALVMSLVSLAIAWGIAWWLTRGLAITTGH